MRLKKKIKHALFLLFVNRNCIQLLTIRRRKMAWDLWLYCIGIDTIENSLVCFFQVVFFELLQPIVSTFWSPSINFFLSWVERPCTNMWPSSSIYSMSWGWKSLKRKTLLLIPNWKASKLQGWRWVKMKRMAVLLYKDSRISQK